MQVFGLQRAVYRGARWSSRCEAAQGDEQTALRADAVKRWREARAAGLTADAAARAVGVSRASLYRWDRHPKLKSRRPKRMRAPTWTPALMEAAEALRLDYPMWGKAKLGPLLRAEGFVVSDATLGRIIAKLVARGAIDPVPLLRSKKATFRSKTKRPHALRLPKGMKAAAPGALVQIDTLTVQIAPGLSIKQFTAYDPVARFTVAEARSNATASAAAQFLDKTIAALPFAVTGVQVDGGSEFMAGFEQACADKGLALYVLPPKTPELNGGVERCNGAWRYEFYAVYDLPRRLAELNQLIDAFSDLYNSFRPHGALAGKTPAQYLATLQAKETQPSQMC
jgi:transposase InsO family protein